MSEKFMASMRRLPDLTDGDHTLRRPDRHGDFYWDLRNGKRSLVVAVPWPSTGRPVWSSWSIDHKNESDAQWTWDGNEDEPIVTIVALTAIGLARGKWDGYRGYDT